MSGGIRSQTIVVGVAAVMLALATVAGLPAPLQAVAAMAVLILLPGWALARLTPVTDVALEVLLVVALGLAALTAVSTAMFYLALWSWQACVLSMAVITVLACLARAWTDTVRARKDAT